MSEIIFTDDVKIPMVAMAPTYKPQRKTSTTLPSILWMITTLHRLVRLMTHQ